MVAVFVLGCSGTDEEAEVEVGAPPSTDDTGADADGEGDATDGATGDGSDIDDVDDGPDGLDDDGGPQERGSPFPEAIDLDLIERLLGGVSVEVLQVSVEEAAISFDVRIVNGRGVVWSSGGAHQPQRPAAAQRVKPSATLAASST